MTQDVLYHNLCITINHLITNKDLTTTILYTKESKSLSRYNTIKIDSGCRFCFFFKSILLFITCSLHSGIHPILP